MSEAPRPIIDFHTHLFPDRLFNAIWQAFVSQYKWEVIYKYYSPECIDYLRSHGVDTIVYSNYAHRTGVAGELNRWNRELVENNDNIFCFAAYHPDDDDALDMAREIVNHPRFAGFKLHLLVQNFHPQDERLFPLYELVIEKQKRILFHTGTGPVGNDFVGFKHFAKLMERYPELPCNVAHMGGLEYGDFMQLLDYCPRMYLDTSFSFFPDDSAGHKVGFNLPREILEKYRERIVYGSDFPNLVFPREIEIDTLRSLGLSDEFYENIFHANGEKLLRQCGCLG